MVPNGCQRDPIGVRRGPLETKKDLWRSGDVLGHLCARLFVLFGLFWALLLDPVGCKEGPKIRLFAQNLHKRIQKGSSGGGPITGSKMRGTRVQK